MFDKLKMLKDKAIDSLSSAASLVGDLNGDGKIDEEDMRIAAEWAKQKAVALGDEASRLGKEAVRSDLAKDAASGAAIGAAVAIPVPVVGPIAGAVIGAGLGMYKNMTGKGSSQAAIASKPERALDVHAELLKLDDLRQRGIITQAEFDAQKRDF